MAIRRVFVDLVNVDSSGAVIDKNSKSTTLNTLKNFNTEHRVIGPTTGDSASPNAASTPTISAYLEAEITDGFQLIYMDQYQIITQDVGSTVSGGTTMDDPNDATVTGTSSQILPANQNRNFLAISNLDTVDTVFLAFGTDAELGKGIALGPSGSLLLDTIVSRQSVHAISDGASSDLAIQEGSK